MSDAKQPRMAIRDLGVLSYVMGHTAWHHNAREAAHALADVLAPGVFDAARDMMKPGDMIVVSAVDGGCMLFVDSVADGVRVRVMARTER